jgi:hypothetical protein
VARLQLRFAFPFPFLFLLLFCSRFCARLLAMTAFRGATATMDALEGPLQLSNLERKRQIA